MILNLTTKLIALSFRQIPDRVREESSQSELQDGCSYSMRIGGRLDAGSSPA